MHEHNEHIGFDKTGVSLSALCLVHCLAGPLLLVMFPLYARYADETIFHLVLAPALVIVAGLAFYRGYKQHARLRVIAAGSIGLIFLICGIFAPHIDLYGPLSMQAVLSSIGSFFLIAAHAWNIHYCRCGHSH